MLGAIPLTLVWLNSRVIGRMQYRNNAVEFNTSKEFTKKISTKGARKKYKHKILYPGAYAPPRPAGSGGTSATANICHPNFGQNRFKRKSNEKMANRDLVINAVIRPGLPIWSSMVLAPRSRTINRYNVWKGKPAAQMPFKRKPACCSSKSSSATE